MLLAPSASLGEFQELSGTEDIGMSPTHREPQGGANQTRSAWTTTSIFVALIMLTILMAVFANRLIQESQRRPADRLEIQAGKGP
jgi:hypothetical protein